MRENMEQAAEDQGKRGVELLPKMDRAKESVIAQVQAEHHQAIGVGERDRREGGHEGKPRSEAQNQQQEEGKGFRESLHRHRVGHSSAYRADFGRAREGCREGLYPLTYPERRSADHGNSNS